MRVWEIADAYGIDHLKLSDRTEPKPSPGQILVAMKAASLNYRDLLTVNGMGGQFPLPLVPFSDGAGEVIALGAGVSRVKQGDRVCPSFFQSWTDGPVADYSRAIRLNRRFALAYNNRGNAFAEKGEYDRAIVDFTRALRLDPKLALAYYNRSSTFSKKGEHERGLADYNRALRLDPKIATAHYNRVIAYSAKGGHDPARADYHQPKPIVATAGKK